MQRPETNLSLAALAFLAIMVERVEVGVEELRAAVPQPSIYSDWINVLQSLLDAGYCIRTLGREKYLYRPTAAGIDYLRAHLHPRGFTYRSMA